MDRKLQKSNASLRQVKVKTLTRWKTLGMISEKLKRRNFYWKTLFCCLRDGGGGDEV